MELLSSQLHLITARLSFLTELPFDRAEYLLQGGALIADIHSAQVFFVELKQCEILRELSRTEGAALDTLLQEIDYDLAVIQLQISSLKKGFPDDETFYRDRLGKLSEQGSKLEQLTTQLATLYSKYYS